MKIALTNVPPDHAQPIANALIEERIVACVNIYPIKSVYRWKGEVCAEEEVTLMMKVSAQGVARLEQRLTALHPYEVMEFLVLDIDAQASSAAYIDFVRDATQ